MTSALTGLMMLTGAAQAASGGTVILSQQECGYIMVNLGGGSQALLKLIRGEAPRPGDRVDSESALQVREFADFTNRRDQQEITVWVDMIDRSSHRALGRYGQYCN
ncbi:hypothetical protein K8B33_05635 [Alcanivorax sp. JB21]|uniref:hypothetical protein n=1 Tax=Alcanivorax limicola TaxID=2874102 RepID=UPI001CC15A99|nr:hypothetical protein [Alcanivorax limicola]MBZ2188567.1 hypothetical protein [Alcanivorax limicola]